MAELSAEYKSTVVDTPSRETVPILGKCYFAPQQDFMDDGKQLSADSDVDGDADVMEIEHDLSYDNSLVPRHGLGIARLSSSWVSLLQDGNKKYPLRDKDRTTFRGSGWLDLDDTGNYDPTTERQRAPRPAKVSKRLPIQPHNNYNEHLIPKRHQPRTVSDGHGRKTGHSHFVALNAKAQEGLKKLKGLAIEYPTPDEQGKGQEDLGSNEFALQSPTGGDVIEGNMPNVQLRSHSSPSDRPDEEYENIHKNVEGRTCKHCYHKDLQCSLTEDPLSHECQICREHDYECILITPPLPKSPCQRCRRIKLTCVYSKDGGIDLKSCDNCESAKVVCIPRSERPARNDNGFISEGKATNSDSTTEKRCVTCFNCRKNKIWCSIRSKADSGPCNNCIRNKLSCTFEAISKPSILLKQKKPKGKAQMRTRGVGHRLNIPILTTKKQKRLFDQASKRNFRSESPEISFKSTIAGGKIKNITTSYCHPISFNWKPPPPLPPSPYSDQSSTVSSTASSFPCHFCTHPGLPYALVGLGSQVIEVIEWDEHPEAGYEELENGWSSKGEEATRMCVPCTMERVLISACEGHEIRRIEGLDPRYFDVQAALERVVIGMTNKNGNEKMQDDGTKWCRICIMPAFYECCVRPRFDKHGRATCSSDNIGCGLLLCEVCAFRMKGSRRQNLPSNFAGTANVNASVKHEGFASSYPAVVKAVLTLDEHIASAAADAFNYPDGLRADVSFLTSEGELMRRLGHVHQAKTRVVSPESVGAKDESQGRKWSRGSKKVIWGMGNFIDLT